MSDKRSIASALLLVPLVGCASDKVVLQWLGSAGPPTFAIRETFGQLVETAPSVFTVRTHVEVDVSPATTSLQVPSSGVVEFAALFDGLPNCLLLAPKLRRSGETFSSLGAGLDSAKALRFALCNMDNSGTLLRDAIRDIFVARGLSAPDAGAAATAFLDAAHPDHARFAKVDVKAPPDVAVPASSVLGRVSAGRLRLAAFRWDDDGDRIVQSAELTYFNPLPYLAAVVPAGAVLEQAPVLEAFELQSSADPAFAAPTTHSFDVTTGAMIVPAPIGGFVRARMKLEVHSAADPAGPTVAPWEITYELRTGGTLRTSGTARYNRLKTADAAATAGRLYHTTGSSNPSANVLWLQLPVDAAATGSPINATTGTMSNILDLGPWPSGAAELKVTLRSALASAPSFSRTFAFSSAGGAALSLDVDADGSTSGVVDGWDSYLPGFEGATARLSDTTPQSMKLFITGLSVGASVEFSLTGTTDWTGINGNVTSAVFPNAAADPDFVLNDSIGATPNGADGPGPITRTVDFTGNAWVWVRCRDFAASTTVQIRIDGGPPTTRLLPRNSDASPTDHLPDAWETPFGNLTDTSDDDADLATAPPRHAERGDGLSAFEEYRGFRILDPAAPATRIFARTDRMIDAAPGAPAGRNGGPQRKDAFVADVGAPEPFRTFGQHFTTHQISWHMVHPTDKGDDPAEFLTHSGKLNLNTDAGQRIQDQFAVLIQDVVLPPSVLGSAGEIFWNDPAAATFHLANIDVRFTFFSITPPDARIDSGKANVLAHEIGHRLTLLHILDRFTLDADDVKALGSAPQPGQKVILVDGASKVQVRMRIQRRSDAGHIDHGYSIELPFDDPPTWPVLPASGAVAFTPPLAQRFVWEEVLVGPDPLADWRVVMLDIPPAHITTRSPGLVEVADVVFDFKTSATALIAAVKAGTKTAEVIIMRGDTCLMDAKFSELSHRTNLDSVEPGLPTVNLFERIRLKTTRPVVAGQEHG